MKAKCIRLVNSVSGELESRNSWLTMDKEYVVLAVSMLPGREAMFRLIGDDGRTPALFEACQFTVTVGDLPSIWKAQSAADGGLELGPGSWLRQGFWEEYFNGAPEAIADFQQARAAIFEGLEPTL